MECKPKHDNSLSPTFKLYSTHFSKDNKPMINLVQEDYQTHYEATIIFFHYFQRSYEYIVRYQLQEFFFSSWMIIYVSSNYVG